jgi:death on curing protein
VTEPRWLSRLLVDVIHSELLAEHGGRPGVRAGGDDLIESALARPRHHYLYAADADLASVAAAYLVGLTLNHGYVDGNKRVGFACAATFLRLNGVRLTAPEVEAYDIVIGLTEGRITEEQIATWIRANTTQ